MMNQRSALRHRAIPPSLRTPVTSLRYSNKPQSAIRNLVARLVHWGASIVHRFVG